MLQPQSWPLENYLYVFSIASASGFSSSRFVFSDELTKIGYIKGILCK